MHVDRFFDFPFVAASEGETFLYEHFRRPTRADLATGSHCREISIEISIVLDGKRKENTTMATFATEPIPYNIMPADSLRIYPRNIT